MSAASPAVPSLSFRDGGTIPQLGYGVFKVDPEVAADVTAQALEAGYRHIDTAKIYGHGAGAGRASAGSGAPREEAFVATQPWGGVGRGVACLGVPRAELLVPPTLRSDAHACGDAIAACEAALARLGLDCVDLYLVHWAVPEQGQYVEAWKALIALQERGLGRT